jgi:hypothetical protein
LCLTYLCDPDAIDELNTDCIVDDLSDDLPEGELLPQLNRYRLIDYDHLVLVTERSSGRYVALLAANDGATTQEDFLQLKAVFVAPVARGQNLMQRMIALTMLRIGGLRPVPSVIVAVANTWQPACYLILRQTARRFSGAVFFPDPEGVVINFRAATLARRIAHAIGPGLNLQTANGTTVGGKMIAAGNSHFQSFAREPKSATLFDQRMLAVIDLRGDDEASILGDARRIYRSRSFVKRDCR